MGFIDPLAHTGCEALLLVKVSVELSLTVMVPVAVTLVQGPVVVTV
jgi:hypothetical protein